MQQGDVVKNFELAQDMDQVARKSLKDKMDKVILKSVTRLVLKKVAEYSLRKEDQTAGALLGIANAITEQADNRNWQTLPQAIHYTRMSLPAGKQKVTLTATGNDYKNSFDFEFDIWKNRTKIHSFQTLETLYFK